MVAAVAVAAAPDAALAELVSRHKALALWAGAAVVLERVDADLRAAVGALCADARAAAAERPDAPARAAAADAAGALARLLDADDAQAGARLGEARAAHRALRALTWDLQAKDFAPCGGAHAMGGHHHG